MKKSQLRQIIKEEINGLMNEAPTAPFQEFVSFTQNNPGLAFDHKCWLGMRRYAYQILNLPNFTSSNPNQPCNFINQRIQHFTNLLSQSGPNSQSAHIRQCKLDFFNVLHQMYNC